MFQERGLLSKIMFVAMLATEMFSFLAYGIDTIVEAYVEADVGLCVGDGEGPDGVARDGIGNGDQDGVSFCCLLLECGFIVVGACD